MDNEQLLCAISDILDKKLIPVDSRLDKMDKRFDKMDERFDKLEAQVEALKIGQEVLRDDVRILDIKVTRTYELALEAWGKSTENRFWIQNSRMKLD